MYTKLIFNLNTYANFSNLSISMLTCLFFLSSTQQVAGQAKLDFSHERGFSDAPFNLTITAEDPSVTIRYTLDGEEPSTNSGEIYNSPILVQTTTVLRAIGYITGVDTSKIYTHTYIFIDEVINQPENIAGWPNNSYDIGSGRTTAVHDYEMDPAIVNSPLYNADLIKGLTEIPSMSIVMPRDNFWEMNDGNAEKKASIELLYADDPDRNEQEDGGIEGHSHDRLKRSYRLSFKNIYGAGDWDSDIFRNAVMGSETAENEFDRIVLRAGNNRAWSRNWNTDRTAYTRDEWMRQSQIAASGIGSHGTFVHLYVNGLYWGLYNPIERPDESFTSTYLGGEKEDWFAVSHGGDQGGNDDRYDYLRNELLGKNLTNSTNYEELKSYLDVDKFSDYLLLSWMTGVQDWPGNNWWGGISNNPAGRFMFFAWDNEWSWDVTKSANNGAWVHPDFRSNDTGGRNSALVFNKVKVNEDFMMSFVDRVYKLCFNNGVMTDDNSRLRWSVLNDHIKNAVVAESARWGDGINDGKTRTRDEHWQNEVDRLDGLMNGNVQRLIDALRAEDYYPMIDPPLFKNNGEAIEVPELSVSSGFTIGLENPNNNGVIYYTTNGVDPRMSRGEVSADAIAYSNEDLNFHNSTTLLARVKDGNEWSALHPLNLIVQQDLSWIKLTEIMYHPADFGAIDGSELEFLEIKNTSSSLSLDISGLQISDGVEFTFPIGTIMTPQSFLVVASNAEQLASKCPGLSVFGEYEGALSNGGEKIEFTTSEGERIIFVEYDDKDPWPIAADGDGYSLVASDVNPIGAQDGFSFWKLSADNVCGSPGADDEDSSNRILAKVFLEGLYNGSTGLTKEESHHQLIPLNQPFHQAPWRYNGSESTTSIPSDVVDWILLVTRSADGQILEQVAGFININGELVGVDGSLGIRVSNTNTYFSIHHKSHLAIMSATSYSGGVYDFTSDLSLTIGNDQQLKQGNHYMMYAGDFDCNGIINSLDFNKWKQSGASLNQYLNVDGDANSIINNLDFNLWVRNRSQIGHGPLRY